MGLGATRQGTGADSVAEVMHRDKPEAVKTFPLPADRKYSPKPHLHTQTLPFPQAYRLRFVRKSLKVKCAILLPEFRRGTHLPSYSQPVHGVVLQVCVFAYLFLLSFLFHALRTTSVSVASLKHCCLRTRSSVHSALEIFLLMRYINLRLLTYLLTYNIMCERKTRPVYHNMTDRRFWWGRSEWRLEHFRCISVQQEVQLTDTSC